jgi:hypothetical protein
MLKCIACGKVVRCCHICCPDCGEPMVDLDRYEEEVARLAQKEVARGTGPVPEVGTRVPLATGGPLSRPLSLGSPSPVAPLSEPSLSEGTGGSTGGQCKYCGQRTSLHIVTEYGDSGRPSMGICKECFLEQNG